MTLGKLQNLIFLDLQNFPRATHMANKWPQSNKLFKLRNELSCTNITRWFSFFGVQKIKSSFQFVWTTFVHYSLLKPKCSHLQQFVVYPPTTFFKRSSIHQTSQAQFWCPMTTARLDFVLWRALYGWCLSHYGVRHEIERTRDICLHCVFSLTMSTDLSRTRFWCKFKIRRTARTMATFNRKPESQYKIKSYSSHEDAETEICEVWWAFWDWV